VWKEFMLNYAQSPLRLVWIIRIFQISKQVETESRDKIG
jgi:hypothetical protein